jgi:hypothetical protein
MKSRGVYDAHDFPPLQQPEFGPITRQICMAGRTGFGLPRKRASPRGVCRSGRAYTESNRFSNFTKRTSLIDQRHHCGARQRRIQNMLESLLDCFPLRLQLAAAVTTGANNHAGPRFNRSGCSSGILLAAGGRLRRGCRSNRAGPARRRYISALPSPSSSNLPYDKTLWHR